MAANDTIFSFGDSKVAIDNPRSWHDILAANLGLGDRYWAKYGRTMQQLNTNYPADNSVQYLIEHNLTSTLDVPTEGLYYHSSRVLAYFSCFGTNDVLQYTDPSNTIPNFKAKYRSYINRLLTLGWPSKKLYIINLDIIDFTKFPVPGNLTRLVAYNQAILEIANEFGIRHLDVYSNQVSLNNPIGILSDDGLHLSLLGNQINAAFIQAQMNVVTPPDPVAVTSVKGRHFINLS